MPHFAANRAFERFKLIKWPQKKRNALKMAANAFKFFAVLSRLERMTQKDQKKAQETTLKRDRKNKESRQR